jgi:tRNA (guanosine-2'-O-)-methyltransferase
MEDNKKSKPSLRARADRIKDFRCKNLIAVIEQPEDLRNIGTIIRNVILHEADYTKLKKLAVWFGNEGIGISRLALERSEFCVNIPMFGIIESLNLGTSSGIVFYEITKQRRAFQEKLKAKISAKKQSKNVV